MKAPSERLLRLLTLVGCAAAQNGYLHLFDIEPRLPSDSISTTINSHTANAILARRIDVTDSRKLGILDDTVLDQLDRFGGHQRLSLFGDENTSTKPHTLIVAIEGYDETLPALPGIVIENPDTDLANNLYMMGLFGQDSTRTTGCRNYVSLRSGLHVSYMLKNVEGSCAGKVEIVQLLGGEDMEGLVEVNQEVVRDFLAHHGQEGIKAYLRLDMTRIAPEAHHSAIQKTLTTLSKVLEPLAQSGRVESAILILPSRRSPPPLNLNRRQTPLEEVEEPLSQPFISTSSEPSTISTSPSNSNSTHHPLPPLGTFLPSCFPTNTTCTTLTNSCSSHGFCYPKSSKCFACKCGSTIVRQDSDGKNVKSVQWGGTACERKDVSVPFFLFAGFGVVMTAVVVGAVGMMYSMGAEELPSVIGAGVTGVRAQR